MHFLDMQSMVAAFESRAVLTSETKAQSWTRKASKMHLDGLGQGTRVFGQKSYGSESPKTMKLDPEIWVGPIYEMTKIRNETK